MFCRKHQVGVAYVADLLLRTERHGYHGLQKKFSVKADLRRFEVPLIRVLRLWCTIVFKDYKTVPGL